jgi:hypothetical protein
MKPLVIAVLDSNRGSYYVLGSNGQNASTEGKIKKK